MNRLQRVKENVVRRALPKADHVSERYWGTVAAFSMSYSVGRSIIEFCREMRLSPNDSRILIVGAHGGRDFHWLTGFGYQVDVLDLGDHDFGASTYVGDAGRTETWNQIKSDYDLIVMHDVLEHLPEDFAAMCNARTALKPDGFLLISVPYRHDEPTHVRSYSEATLGRLVSLAGYKSVWRRDRPGALEAFPRLINFLNYSLAMLMPSAEIGGHFLHGLLKAEYAVNERTRRLYRLFGNSPQKGLTLAAQPSTKGGQDHVQINRQVFIS